MGILYVLEYMMFKGIFKVFNDEFSCLSWIYGGIVNVVIFINYINYY